MKVHLIQPRELFGPEERRAELREAWKRSEGVFDEYTFPKMRPTFAELFALCQPGMVNVIANSDMFYLKPFSIMVRAYYEPGLNDHVVMALSRYDVPRMDGTNAALWAHPDSQDTWVIHGGPHEVDAHTYLSKDGTRKPFTMGVAGCDNRLLFEIQRAGFTVINPSKTIRTYHLHNTAYRSYLTDPTGKARGGDKIERIPPPYGLVKPTYL